MPLLQVGVENIREYMEQNQAATEDFARRRMSLTSQVRPLARASKACLMGKSAESCVLDSTNMSGSRSFAVPVQAVVTVGTSCLEVGSLAVCYR